MTGAQTCETAEKTSATLFTATKQYTATYLSKMYCFCYNILLHWQLAKKPTLLAFCLVVMVTQHVKFGTDRNRKLTYTFCTTYSLDHLDYMGER